MLCFRNGLCPCCRRRLENLRLLFIELVPNNVDDQQNVNGVMDGNLIPIRDIRGRRIDQGIQYNLPLFQMAPENDMDMHQFFVNLPESNLWRQIYINVLSNQIRIRIIRDRNRRQDSA